MSESSNFSVSNVSLIVAISRNGVIGRDGGLPWRLPEDLKRFKALTMGHHIIMGRRTFESLGRCLPGRTNVVVTQSDTFAKMGAIVVESLEEALAVATNDDEPFVIGGVRIFESAWRMVNRVYLTQVLVDVNGDTRLDLKNLGFGDSSRWTLSETSAIQYSAADRLPFQFQTLQRTSKPNSFPQPPDSLTAPLS